MIYLRYLDGVGPLEWALIQNGWTGANEERAAALSEHLVGIEEDDTHSWIDDDGKLYIGGVEVEPGADAPRLLQEWEAHFEPMRMFRDESDAYWASVGWDVTNEEGKQLEVMRHLGRPLVCAVKRIHVDAALNIGQQQEADAWGESLAEEARRFKPHFKD